jgi:hypothetical protein
MSDNLIERLTRAAAEADGQVWEGLSCKHTYANMVGATLEELAKSGERAGAEQLATEYRNQIIQELRALALGSEADEYKSYDGHVAEWLAAMLDEPNAEPNRLTEPAAKIKDEARWVAFDDVCRAANKAGEALPPSVRKLIGGAWADKHVRGGE